VFSVKSENTTVYAGYEITMSTGRKVKTSIFESWSLMEEWDTEKNTLDPHTISPGSDRVVWWKCSKGHSYEMQVNLKAVRNYGCPICSGHRVEAGFNDFASAYPDLLKVWDFERNDIRPDEVTRESNKKVWWTCPQGHSYEMTVHKKVSRNAGCPVCSGHKTVKGINDFATLYPELAKEWHPEKNGNLKPTDVSKKNGKKVWWQCRYGHEWLASVHDRADGTGCPFCAEGRLTSFPEQAIFYYIKKLYPDALNRYKGIFNNGMELDIYVPSVRFAVEFDGAYWHGTNEVHAREKTKYDICRENEINLIRVKENSDNDWRDVADVIYIIKKRRNKKELQSVIQAILDSIDRESNMWTRKNPFNVYSRVSVDIERDEYDIRKYLTPISNSLKELRPDLAAEWNYEKNGSLTPDMFGVNSNDYAWWKCGSCGHEWRTRIIQRGGKRNSGCPECSKIIRGRFFTKMKVREKGSLAENNPTLAKEWHPVKNGNLTPWDITEKKFKKVWWLCSRCGYEWEASPLNRSKGVGCPCCSGRVPKTGVNDLRTLYPELVREWDYSKNTGLQPECFLPGSGKKVWWKCKVCGHEWEATIHSRTKGSGCPKYRKHNEAERLNI